MPVITRQNISRRTAPFVPVLIPTWDDRRTPFLVGGEGQYSCGHDTSCDLPVRLDGVAAHHCDLLLQNGRLTVLRVDGYVWVNDLPVDRSWPLEPGDILSVGPATFQVDALKETADAAGPALQASRGPQNDPARIPTSPLRHRNHDLSTDESHFTSADSTERNHAEVSRREELLDKREAALNELVAQTRQDEAALEERRRALEELSDRITQQKSELTEQRLE
ncbi:MAG: hypothetical protein KDA85_03930, partial [Planctomycetaceae bacterium]|nr:hypothetical protein [Planctomycetaceae bacterium]